MTADLGPFGPMRSVLAAAGAKVDVEYKIDPSGYMAQELRSTCPIHNPSGHGEPGEVSITMTPEGRFVIGCIVGCDGDAIYENAAAKVSAAIEKQTSTNGDGNGWGSGVDTSEVVSAFALGDVDRPTPRIGRIAGGSAVLYSGLYSAIAGPSGIGKTFVAMVLAAEEMRSGRDVVYIDCEDSAEGVIGRLLEMGVTAETISTRFHYRKPSGPFDGPAFLASIKTRPGLIVIDSTGEAMALDGFNPDSDSGVAAWTTKVPRWLIARTGAAVLGLDHTNKAGKRDLFASGSHRKRDGVAALFMLRSVEPFARGHAGYSELVCAKDRHGTYRSGQTVAEVRVEPDESIIAPDYGPGVRITLVAPTSTDEDTRDTTGLAELMEALSASLEGADKPLSAFALRKEVKKRNDDVRDALDQLVSEGFAKSEPGPRNGTYYVSVHPFRSREQVGASEPQSGVVPRSPLGGGIGNNTSELFRPDAGTTRNGCIE